MQTKEALRLSESLLRLKLDSIINPKGNIDDLELSDVIDVADIQRMMDNFNKLVKIPMAIIDLKGKVLVGVGWQEICTRFHRVHPETLRNCIQSDLQLTDSIPHGEYKLYKCKNGMWDMATPIYIGDRQMGNLFLGQFFFVDESIDLDHFRSQALKYNFDQTEYLNSLNKVPRLNKEDFESAKIFFSGFANKISELSYSNIRLVRSVSEIEASQILLKESKAHLERSQEIAHLGSWEMDLTNNKLSWSDEVYRIFGLTKGKFKPTYEAFLDAIHPEDRAAVDNAYSNSLKENRTTYEIEHRVVRKDNGEIRFVHEKCEHFMDGSGRINRSIGMIHDITERKNVEIKLQELTKKLHVALETGNIGVWEWNLNTEEMILDERMREMINLETGSFGETYEDFENLLNPEDIPHLRNEINKALNENTSFDTVFRIRVKNGEYKFLNSKALIEKDSSGNPVKMKGVCFDITEMKRGAEQALFNLNEKLLSSNNDLQQFAYIASHDMQEPLRMISSFTQLLSQRYSDKLDKDGQEFIHYIVDGAKRLQNQINDLLTLSRIQTKGNEFILVDMQKVLKQVIKNLKISINAKNGHITNDVLHSVNADEGQMIQLLQNLLENALKYCNDTPGIHVSSKEEDNYYLFSVKDNGIGIEQKYRERIFQIFQRLHSRETFEGTGIGLAICKRIIERHKGKIWVESDLGKGSKFYFTIPK